MGFGDKFGICHILFYNVETYSLNIFPMEKPSYVGKQYLKYIPDGIITSPAFTSRTVKFYLTNLMKLWVTKFICKANITIS